MPYIVPDAVREPLYAVVPYFNPWRWKSREKHTIRAIKHFVDSGAVVVLVEAAFNRREFAFADSGLDGTPANCAVMGDGFRHKYIGLRTKDELWLKENLINLAVAQLPYDWQNVCWLDSDVHFLRPNWVGECIHKLQHYAFLQMFSHARDVSPDYEVMPEDYPHADGVGFVHHHTTSISRAVAGTLTEMAQGGDHVSIKLDLETTPVPYGAARVWPGLAWACTREAWDAVGGLMDFAIWGGGDWHAAHALVETPDIDTMMRADLHPNYRNMVLEWRARCCAKIRRNVGVMSGSIFHHWHGLKLKRGYVAKHRLLSQTKFDPMRHLKRDYQGLYQLHDDGSETFVALRDMLRQIARERDEDSSDTRADLWEQGH
jgi:hypothetical protein